MFQKRGVGTSAASPLVTAPPSNLTRLYYNGSAAKSTTTQYRQLRRLSLILRQHGYRNNFRFRLYGLFSCLCFIRQDAGGYAISLQNNLLLAFALPYLLIDFTMVCLWCGRSRNSGIYMLARDSYARGAPLMTS